MIPCMLHAGAWQSTPEVKDILQRADGSTRSTPRNRSRPMAPHQLEALREGLSAVPAPGPFGRLPAATWNRSQEKISSARLMGQNSAPGCETTTKAGGLLTSCWGLQRDLNCDGEFKIIAVSLLAAGFRPGGKLADAWRVPSQANALPNTPERERERESRSQRGRKHTV